MAQYPNWFHHYAEGFFKHHLTPLSGKPGLRFLQIGAFTGDASVWMLDNILTDTRSVLVDVDTWGGSDEAEHEPFDFADVEAVYDERMRGTRTCKFKGTSSKFFQAHPESGIAESFDFIYIDGGHNAYTVLNDAVRAYPMLKLGGMIAFDDYQWKSGHGRLRDPGPAIDVILDLYSDRLELLTQGLQAWFRKSA
jgi:predicted O-methyltransferase YrrM